MPIDYSRYPANWKSEIRPRILERESHCCKFCKVPNKSLVCRGMWKGIEVWQDDDGSMFRADNGEHVGDTYVGDVWSEKNGGLVKIVLTIAHLDHDVTNNADDNLAALCQKCHLNYDKDLHRQNSRSTIAKKKGIQELF